MDGGCMLLLLGPVWVCGMAPAAGRGWLVVRLRLARGLECELVGLCEMACYMLMRVLVVRSGQN